MINAVLTGLMVKGDCVSVAKRRNVGAIAAVLVVILAAVPLVLHSLERARSAPDAAAARLPLDAPLPAKIPPGTRLVPGDPPTPRVLQYKSEERRGGTECVSTSRSRWSPYQ